MERKLLNYELWIEQNVEVVVVYFEAPSKYLPEILYENLKFVNSNNRFRTSNRISPPPPRRIFNRKIWY
jgi:hypothetical protein